MHGFRKSDPTRVGRRTPLGADGVCACSDIPRSATVADAGKCVRLGRWDLKGLMEEWAPGQLRRRHEAPFIQVERMGMHMAWASMRHANSMKGPAKYASDRVFHVRFLSRCSGLP
ncbi:hypothetical protein NDU88_000874 [Pleurodeles waltl]|uniref:Uncharacterized protein n=1 Tax=Pleurodeles waltl TaxID=8319 RepID=A0AAV7V820_PLEWA|nr:hypothetical protein NDU88_000874 [Pleurodeles waltl]